MLFCTIHATAAESYREPYTITGRKLILKQFNYTQHQPWCASPVHCQICTRPTFIVSCFGWLFVKLFSWASSSCPYHQIASAASLYHLLIRFGMHLLKYDSCSNFSAITLSITYLNLMQLQHLCVAVTGILGKYIFIVIFGSDLFLTWILMLYTTFGCSISLRVLGACLIDAEWHRRPWHLGDSVCSWRG